MRGRGGELHYPSVPIYGLLIYMTNLGPGTVRSAESSDAWSMVGRVNRQTPTFSWPSPRHPRMLLPSLSALLTIAAFAAAQLVIPDLDHDRARLSAMLTDQDTPDAPPVDLDDLVRAPMLADVLTLEPRASIFFSYARESARLSGILAGDAGDAGSGEKKYTVFAPMNRAVMALPRKPYVYV